MDLLVFLVRRRELDVAYISVSAIVADYLMYLSRTDLNDLNDAGDFIFLAALLLEMKVSELLPAGRLAPGEAEFGEVDHERSYAEILALQANAAKLAELEARQINLFSRGGVHLAGMEEELAEEMLSDVSLYDIALVFRDLITNLPPEPTHIIEDIPYTLEGQMGFILSFFSRSRKVAFRRLAEALSSRLAVIMTFLAVLELIRRGSIRVRQAEPFGPLLLVARDEVRSE